MGTIIRPDMLKSALAAKLAAATAEIARLREAEEARLTPHLNPREIVATALRHTRGVYAIADTFGKAQAGDLVFNAWYDTWRTGLPKAGLALWRELGADSAEPGPRLDPELIDDEISVAADPSIVTHPFQKSSWPQVPKRRVRFAAHANRPASDVCDDYLKLARRFVDDFIRANERFLPGETR
jgi:hypothetical protein